MNKEELREELKKNLGLTDEVLLGIKDDQLELMSNKLKPKELSFNDFLSKSENQAEFDRRMSKAIETVKKKSDTKPEPPKTEIKGDQPEWVKSLLAQNEKLAQEITEIKNGTVAQSKLEKAKSILRKTKLPDNLKETWISRVDINSETPIEDQVNGLTKEYESLVQSFADNKDLSGNPPPGSKQKPGMSKEELKKALG